VTAVRVAAAVAAVMLVVAPIGLLLTVVDVT
jgi:hypothetical protein